MENCQLSVELQELERALASRPLPGPSAHLRQTVLGDVQRRFSREPGRARWRFVLTAAAVVLLWLNLSLAATRSTDFGLRVKESGESIEIAARQIKQFVPEISLEESRRQAILLRAGSSVVPCPDLSYSGDAAFLARSFPLDERGKERSN